MAEASNVNIETVRYYEKRGLIPEPPRTETGYRVYSFETVERIRFIKRAQELGFTLNEVKELLKLSDHQKTADSKDVKKVAVQKIHDIQAKIKDLEKIKTALMDLSAACPGSGYTIDQCPMISVRLLEVYQKERNNMAKRRVEIFTAGCSVCDGVVKQVRELACTNCDVVVYDLNKKCDSNECVNKANRYGVQTVPAVAINGELVDCCKNTGIEIEVLKAAGLGQMQP